MSVRGIDVSSNNGPVDWHKVYASGVRFAFIKVSEGDYVWENAGLAAQEAKKAGLLVGAYCFVSPREGRTGAQEADYFLRHARNAGLLDKGCLRPVCDIEVTALAKGKPSRRYHYRFIERVSHVLGSGTFHTFDGKPFIYTGSWFWDGVLAAKNSHGCPLWLAAYSTGWKRFIPQGFRKGVSVHQFTDKGTVPGSGRPIDINRYFGRNVKVLRRRHCLLRKV